MISLSDTILFKTRYRLAQQYNLESKWLDFFVYMIREGSTIDEAVLAACKECGLF